MDTRTFLKTILPERGVKYIARIKPRPGDPRGDLTIHEAFMDTDDAADRTLELDREYSEQNIYFAMASYKEVQYRTKGDFEYVVGRTQDNALNVKSLWIDWDVGKTDAAGNLKPDSYATRGAVKAALNVYLAATGLPVPVIISSGYGVHTYWVFDEEIPASEWASIAANQRVIMRHLGIKFDPSRDSDVASILRPVGCRNKKSGVAPQIVRPISEAVNSLPAMEYKRLLRGYVETHNLTTQVIESAPIWAAGKGNISDLKDDFPDSYAAIAVEHCKQLQEFSKTGGKDEPTWYATLGLLKHCKDGQKYAHEWGANYADYDYDRTETKMEQWGKGPTTCQTFKEKNATGCEGCKQKCNSPIALGVSGEITLPNLKEIAAEADDKATSFAHAIADTDARVDNGLPIGWPAGFGYDKANNQVTMKVKDDTGVWKEVRIATPLFYPVEQIRAEDNTYMFRMHYWQRGKVREFTLPTAKTADPRSLKMHLHANQINVSSDKGAASFLSNYMTEMAKIQEETDTYRQMGWKHDFKGWLVGDALITETEVKRVTLAKTFTDERRELYNPKGTAQQWVDAVKELYNREHGEPHQFAICAAFAAPLHDLLGFTEWSGIPFALTTDRSGYGKTTVNLIANSIWYAPTKGKVSNSTALAVLGVASEFNNIPFVLDEITDYLKDPAALGGVLYAMSNGRSRERLRQDGSLSAAYPPWRGCCSITGNRNILTQIAENKLNPEAMQMRVFEIDLDSYPRIATMVKGSPEYDALYAKHNAITTTLMEECSGVIGTEYVRYVMKHLDEVRDMLRKTSQKMAKFMDGDATKERFYYHLITCVIVGGCLAKKLGYVDFDMNNLLKWCVNHVRRLRSSVEEISQSPQDMFASMMSDFANHLLVTKRFSTLDGRKGQAESHVGMPLRNPIYGRYVIGDEKERTQLYVSVQAIQQWCTEKGASFNAMRRDFIKENLIRFGNKDVNRQTGSVRISISRGVAGVPYLGKPWCLELDAEKVADMLVPQAPADIVPIRKEAGST